MDIHQLKVFCSVYKNRSFSRASEEMYLSQPTVSDHIKTLEEALGAKLFDRLGRSIAPTAESSLLYPRAMEIIEKFNSLKGELSGASEAPSGEVLVGASSVPGTYFLPRAAAGFKKLFPEVSIKVVARNSREIASMVAADELPLGIVSGKWERKCLQFTTLTEDDLVFAAAPGFGAKVIANPETLLSLPFVLREEGSGTRKEMEAALEDMDIPISRLRTVGTFESLPSVFEAVKSGLGVSAFWRTSISGELERNVLTEIKLKGKEFKTGRKFHVVAHRKKTVPKPARMFMEHLSGLINPGQLAGEALRHEILRQIKKQPVNNLAECPAEAEQYVKI